MNKSPIHVCIVKTPEGEKQYVTVLPPELTFSRGLIPEAIVGVLLRPLAKGESITPEVFARNSVFMKFLHDVVAQYAPEQPGCQAEAKRLGTGWIYILDKRTKTPRGAVPPEDIVGALQVRDGAVVPGSYRASPQYMILSRDGFFQLPPGLHQALMRELDARISAG